MNKTRFEGFSDGVFGFAITLLILGIVLPRVRYTSERDLTVALLGLWPNLLAFMLSFAVIGLMWQNHHALFRLVRQVDRKTILLNLALLAGTVFIPFATSTLGSYPVMRPSTFLYGAALAFCAIANNLMLTHLKRIRAFHGDVSGVAIERTVRAYRGALITYALAAMLALIVPVVSFGSYIIIVFCFLIPRGVDADIVA
jgi:uncharacterized membrane protein